MDEPVINGSVKKEKTEDSKNTVTKVQDTKKQSPVSGQDKLDEGKKKV